MITAESESHCMLPYRGRNMCYIKWHMVVICIWCAVFVMSYSCFQINVLAEFLDIIWIFFYMQSHYLTNYQRSKLWYRRKMNSTLRHSSS